MVTFWFALVGSLAGVGAGAVLRWLTWYGFEKDGPAPKGARFKWRYIGPAAFIITGLGAWLGTLLLPIPGDAGFYFMGASFLGLGSGFYLLSDESEYSRRVR